MSNGLPDCALERTEIQRGAPLWREGQRVRPLN
jgi:hypothetical protein